MPQIDFESLTTILMNIATILSVIFVFWYNQRKAKREALAQKQVEEESKEKKHKELLDAMLAKQKADLERQHIIDQKFIELETSRKECRFESEKENNKRFEQIEDNFEEQMDRIQKVVDKLNSTLLEVKKDIKIEMSDMKKSHESLAKSVESLQETVNSILMAINSEVKLPAKKPATKTKTSTKRG